VADLKRAFEEFRRDAAEHLRHHIGRKILGGETLGHQQPHRYGRVEVTARNMADGESHGQHGEAKGQRHAEKTDAQLGVGGGQHGAAAAPKDQPESPYEFSGSAFGQWHETRSAWSPEPARRRRQRPLRRWNRRAPDSAVAGVGRQLLDSIVEAAEPVPPPP
jgi:hypothetical protein